MAAPKQLKMAYAVQDLAFSALKAWESEHKDEVGKLIVGDTGAGQLAQLVGAFVDAQERVRICRRTPLPGVMRPKAHGSSRKPAPMLILEPQPDEQPITEQSSS